MYQIPSGNLSALQTLAEAPIFSGAFRQSELDFLKTVIEQLDRLEIGWETAMVEEGELSNASHRFPKKSAIILQGSVEVATSNGEGEDRSSFGGGYPILSPHWFFQESSHRKLNLEEGPLQLLVIDQRDFGRMIEEPSVREAFNRATFEKHPPTRHDPKARSQMQKTRQEASRDILARGATIQLAGEIYSILNPHGVVAEVELDGGKTHRFHVAEQVAELSELLSALYLPGSIRVAQKLQEIAEKNTTKEGREDSTRKLPRTLEAPLRRWKAKERFAVEVRESFERSRNEPGREPLSEERIVGQAFFDFCSQLHLEAEMERKRIIPHLAESLRNADIGEKQIGHIRQRALLERWLDSEASPPNYFDTAKMDARSHEKDRTLNRIFQKALKDTSKDRVQQGFEQASEELDSWIEGHVNTLNEQGLIQMEFFGFKKHPPEPHLFLNLAPRCRIVDRSDHRFKVIEEHAARLAEGDLSAVGGWKYPARRIPKANLDMMARGELMVVLHNGPHDDAIQFVRTHASTLLGPRSDIVDDYLGSGTQAEVTGTYGGFRRTLFKPVKSENAFLIISDNGTQLRNALALMLYETEEGARLPTENIILLDHVVTPELRITKAIDDAFRRENNRIREKGVLDEKVSRPREVPTQMLILSNPGGFAAQRKDPENTAVERRNYEDLGEVRWCYWRNDKGELRRSLVLQVGSKGLFGDSAGIAVSAFKNTAEHNRIVPHVLFSATAGAFAGSEEAIQSAGYTEDGEIRGLPKDFSPGSFVMPTEAIVDSRGTVPIRTLFSEAENLILAGSEQTELSAALKRALNRLQRSDVYEVSRHRGVEAPAIETESFLREVIEEQSCSLIDCEAPGMARALSKESGETLTIIDIASDDPRQAIHEPGVSLALGGFIYEERMYPIKIFELLWDLVELADKVEAAKAEKR